MKNGTLYAGKLRKAFAVTRRAAAPWKPSDPDPPLDSLALGVLGVGAGDAAARTAVRRLLDAMVDWNEVRVSTPGEVHAAIGGSIPDGLNRCRLLTRALQSVYDRENVISLDRLRSLGRREARHYLEQVDGADEYAVASVFLWSLGGHAIPVNDILLKELREADLVNPTASRAEVQAFLERNISAAQAKEFCHVMNSFRKSKLPSPRGRKMSPSGGGKRTSKTSAK